MVFTKILHFQHC